MELSCGGSFMKVLLIIFNIIFFICGAVLLGVGIWLMVDPSIQRYLQNIVPAGSDPLFHAAAVVIIVVGAVIFVVGFFGCCGACKENRCMLATFAALLIIILIVEIVGVILAAVFRNKLEQVLKESMDEQVAKVTAATTGDIPPTSSAWHIMQAQLKCCGSSNWTDYRTLAHFNDSMPVPLSCCKLKSHNDATQCYKEGREDVESRPFTDLYPQGCYMALVHWLWRMAGILIGVVVAIALIQILGIIFACCVRSELIKRSDYA